jgi:hypothetical protein
MEFLFSQAEELRSYGLDPNIIEGLIVGDSESQAEASLRLLELLINRSMMEKSGATHVVSRKKGISDRLVNYLIVSALDGMSWMNQMRISRELIVLIRHQLGSPNSEYEIDEERKEKRSQATYAAIRIWAKGRTPTYREIGRALGVQASTVMRWFPDRKFMKELKSVTTESHEANAWDRRTSSVDDPS